MHFRASHKEVLELEKAKLGVFNPFFFKSNKSHPHHTPSFLFFFFLFFFLAHTTPPPPLPIRWQSQEASHCAIMVSPLRSKNMHGGHRSVWTSVPASRRPA
jgi:hypothetical protein